MTFAISIVSHGHADQVVHLLTRLATPGATRIERVWLTLNIPEEALSSASSRIWPFDLQLILNNSTKGFGANHNHAFMCEMAVENPVKFFCVLNPDVYWESDPFPVLLSALSVPQAGCSFPVQCSAIGEVQDYFRELPSPWMLLKRYLSRSPSLVGGNAVWVNAAFLVFPCDVFMKIKGFDDLRYYMYCEDVDLSLRLQMAGYFLVEASTARVFHDASRASRRDWKHFLWHLKSLMQLWTSPVYRAYRSAHRGNSIVKFVA